MTQWGLASIFGILHIKQLKMFLFYVCQFKEHVSLILMHILPHKENKRIKSYSFLNKVLNLEYW